MKLLHSRQQETLKKTKAQSAVVASCGIPAAVAAVQFGAVPGVHGEAHGNVAGPLRNCLGVLGL